MNGNNVDNWVDTAIEKSIIEKKHFFMFAGAGSGKTRSLKNALDFIAKQQGRDLSVQSKSVAVISYTNAACDEIMRRVGYNPLFVVSTIHSFLWELIKPFQKDIKKWVIINLDKKVKEFETKQASPRRRNDYSVDIDKAKRKLERAKTINKFTYQPNGENTGRNSLDHSQVISMGTEFISESITLQKVLVSKYPILLIDESQDTKKELIDAIIKIESVYADEFIIGMFGDMMQRIYADGKDGLENIVPDTWVRPDKVMNHRSNKRIIQLANSIRDSIDGKVQQARSDKLEGIVRLFIVPNGINKDEVENIIYSYMAKTCADDKWVEPNERKTLVLEHSMAASRIGFEGIYRALAKEFAQTFRDGDIAELNFLMNVIDPLIVASQQNDSFALMKLIRKKLKPERYIEHETQVHILIDVKEKINALASLWGNENEPSCIDIYRMLAPMKLFDLPERIESVLAKPVENEDSTRLEALREGLSVPYSELLAYWNYVNDNTQFATHQGIKGLEFDRVSVIMDDESAGGFLFSYEKLFGAKSLTDTDIKNIKDGKDSSISRTRRLLYVTCTRAKESLVLIAYTSNVEAVMKTVISNKWFEPHEVLVYDKNRKVLLSDIKQEQEHKHERGNDYE